MGADSKIEWTHHTFNPWRGCTKVSPGCANCYAETLSHRNPKALGIWGPTGTRAIAAESYWRQPFIWDKAAAAAGGTASGGTASGERPRVFCASLADVFEGKETMPAASLRPVREARLRLLKTIHATPNLDWLLLSKRMQNWRKVIEESIILAQAGDPDDPNYFSDRDGDFPSNELAFWLNEWTGGEPPKNVWLGTSIENQETADERIPHLLRCPARVRFLSCEPLLGPIDLRRYLEFVIAVEGCLDSANPIDLVIVGGESGGEARPMHGDWARSLRDQCQSAGVPFFFKQWGEWTPGENVKRSAGAVQTAHWFDDRWSFDRENLARADGHVDDQPDLYRVGKKAAGRLLDGREWNELP